MWLQQVRVCVCVCVCVWLQQAFVCTGWWRLIGSPKLQIIFHERATKYRSLLRKITYKDKGSYESSPPCSLVPLLEEYPCLRVYGTQIHEVLSSRGFWVFVGIHTCTCPYTCFTSVYIHIHTCVCVCVCVCACVRACVCMRMYLNTQFHRYGRCKQIPWKEPFPRLRQKMALEKSRQKMA